MKTNSPTLFALVDCNNFYVSCERVFRPELINQPVAVLSNNDGCIVARSQEVKNLGIKMATPLYQVEALIKKHRVHLFSSNYSLYADMSNRVMQCLEHYSPALEVYSIDESFLDLSGIHSEDPCRYARQIKHSVQQYTGIPVCIGMGPTKTLAKLANYAAKKWPKTGGVVDLSDPLRREKLLPLVAVGEIWGIGRQTRKRLQLMGIKTAEQLAAQTPESIQTQFNIVVARTVMELNAVSCLALEDIASDKQQIVCSRSFKRRLSDYDELAAALASFCSRAAEKLRQQQSVAGSIGVFIRTNPYNPEEPQYQRSAHAEFKQSTADTRHILKLAKSLLKDIYKSGYRFQKCGVQLTHIQPASDPQQLDLFSQTDQAASSHQLMQTVDQINRRFPKAISVSPLQINTHWQTAVEHLSRRYTTDWNELLRVKCQ